MSVLLEVDAVVEVPTLPELVTNELDKLNPALMLELFTKEKGLDPYLKIVKEQADKFIPDMTTVNGRKEIASFAYKISRSKTALKEIGTAVAKDLKKLPSLVDAERKRCNDYLDQLNDQVRKPLTEWEDGFKKIINQIKELGATNGTSEELLAASNKVAKIFMDTEFHEFTKDATQAKDIALGLLKINRDIALGIEAQKAELEKLRKEKLEADRKLEEERITRAAVDKERERQEAIRRKEREEEIRKEAEAYNKAQKELDEANRVIEEAKRRADAAVAAERAAKQREEAATLKATQAEEKTKQYEVFSFNQGFTDIFGDSEEQKKKENYSSFPSGGQKVLPPKDEKDEAWDEHVRMVDEIIVDAIVSTVPTISELAAIALVDLMKIGVIPNVEINYH